MSSALAAAKKRRAFGEPTNSINSIQSSKPQEPKPDAHTQNNRPMTINQAFKSMSDRVNILEEKVSEGGVTVELVNEYEHRFEMILTEIVNIKDTLLKLQTFSMEVNKSLHDERIKMLSDIDTPSITELDNIEQIFDNSDNVITQLYQPSENEEDISENEEDISENELDTTEQN